MSEVPRVASQAPQPSPHPSRIERRIIKSMCCAGGAGPYRHLLGLHPSTVHRVLARYKLTRLAA